MRMSYDVNSIVSLSQGRAFREKIGMYLSGDKQEAVNLGLRELIVNTQDEYEVYKPQNPILKVCIDTKKKVISVEDNMRGIPVGKREDGMNSLTAAMLINHSGGKHTGGAYESSVGINGCGNKIVNHTATWLEVQVKRDGKVYFQRFESDDEGARPTTEVLEKGKTKETGTKITYSPDPKVYGEYFIQQDKLEEMLKEISYFSRGLDIILNVDGKEKHFLSKNGLVDGLVSKNAISKPFQYFYKTSDCEVELALQWVKKKGLIRGYANGLYMPDGGAFISGFKSSLTRTFNSLANKKFDGDAIRGMLDGFVSVKVKVGQFSNQAKTALANPEARTATSTAISEALKEFTRKRPTDFESIVVYLDKLEKADEAAEKARNAILNHEKKETENKKKKIQLPDKFKDCEKHGEEAMLVVCEGNSALAGLLPARDVSVEALYAVRGKVKNLLKHPLDECLENQEVSDIIMALGCGIQNKYNSKKLNYGKVAIAVDADVDGASIMCLISTLFWVLMPDFIKEGRLCWLRAPLYHLTKNNKRVFAYNDEELKELKKKYPDWSQGRMKGLGEMTAEDMELSMMNKRERRLEVLTIHDTELAKESIEMLMGTEVEKRRDFLFENVDFSKINS